MTDGSMTFGLVSKDRGATYKIFTPKGSVFAVANTLPEIRRKGVDYLKKSKKDYVNIARMHGTGTSSHDYTVAGVVMYEDGSFSGVKGFVWNNIIGKSGHKYSMINKDGTLGKSVVLSPDGNFNRRL